VCTPLTKLRRERSDTELVFFGEGGGEWEANILWHSLCWNVTRGMDVVSLWREHEKRNTYGNLIKESSQPLCVFFHEGVNRQHVSLLSPEEDLFMKSINFPWHTSNKRFTSLERFWTHLLIKTKGLLASGSSSLTGDFGLVAFHEEKATYNLAQDRWIREPK